MSGPGTGEPRTARDALFREEAVSDYLQARTRGQLLRISPAWTSWAFAVVLAAAASAAAFASLAHVDQWVRGPAIVVAGDTGRDVVAFLPAADRTRLALGQPLLLRVEGEDAPRRLVVQQVAPGIVGPSGVRAVIGDGAEWLTLAGPSVMLRAAMPATGAAPPGAIGTAEVRVGRRTLLAALLPGVRR